MACALPVITTRSNGACEFIEQGVNGFVLEDYDDDETLKSYFLELFDEAKRTKMGKSAHETMKEFTWERTMREILEVCEATLDIKRGDSPGGGHR